MKNRIFCIIMAAAVLLGSLTFWLSPDKKQSESERRLLQQLPELSLKNVFDGSFMEDFESYAQDQFPLRELFRSVKTTAELRLFMLRDYNGLYTSGGHIAKQDYPLEEKMLHHAADSLDNIYKLYLEDSDCRIYLSIIPDKNYFIAPEAGRLCLDFPSLEAYVSDALDWAKYIPIAGYLEADDYYRSDSHWRQEKIEDLAAAILNAMGAEALGRHEIMPITHDFSGVYAGQLPGTGISDRIFYAVNDTIRSCSVTSYDGGKAHTVPFYDMAAAEGNDPYEFFLNGADPLLIIENPGCDTGRELIIFRDSFGSSIAPLMIESYSRITLVDTRYIRSGLLADYIEFDDQDVLFLYSSGLLNNSLAMK